MKRKIIILILLFLCPYEFISATKESATKNSVHAYKVKLDNKKIRPRDITSQQVDCYFLSDGKLQIEFNSSEGWADLVVSNPMSDIVHKERFHTAFEFSTFIGIPEEPWKIEITTTGGGDYEGWLILE